MASPVFTDLQASAIAQAVAKSNHLVGAGLQIVHISGLLLLLASVILLGLRAYGLGLGRQSPAEVASETNRLYAIGLSLALGSGTLIFLSSAARYADNAAFDLKILLFAAAITAQWLAQRGLRAGESPVVSLPVKALATLTVVLWFGVAGAGRAIGYI